MKKRIMLVDDDPLVNSVTQSMFEDLGYEVTSFLSSVKAAEEFKVSAKNFDIVVTDYMMPEMNGKEFITKVRKVRKDIPIVLITGFSALAEKDGITEDEIDAVLLKPFSKYEIVKVLQNIFSDKSQVS